MAENQIRQHIPAFFDAAKPQTVEFDTAAELLDVPFVKSWRGGSRGMVFYQFSVNANFLIAEFDGGLTWWVVGHLKSLDGLDDLPRFTEEEMTRRYEARRKVMA